jgi:hypothetical protein
MMTIELRIPDGWTPGLTLAARQMLQGSIDRGFPIIAVVRPDATADQIRYVRERITRLIADAGLAAT